MASSIDIPSATQPVEWITPQEQLDRLHKYNVESIAYPIATSEIPLSDLGCITLPHITSIIAEYAVEGLSPDLTDWHTALKLRGALPDKIPPLPWNMPQIMEGKCPIWGNELKPDGTPYKYSDKWSLSLITPETVNELAGSVKAYGEKALNDQKESLSPIENPLQFDYFWPEACQAHANVRSNKEPYWILHTNTVLPGSRGKSYPKQVRMVADLSAKALVNCEVPSLIETTTACFNRQITRGETLYPKENKSKGHVWTYTRVIETFENNPLAVGGSGPSGLNIYDQRDFDHEALGIAAVRILEQSPLG